MTSHVSARDLSVRFGAVEVLKSLNLDIQKGEFLVLLGASGCGKSTLLNTIAGLQEATEGQIWINDENVTWREPKDRGLAMVFQSYALYPKMTVRGNLAFGLRMNKVPKAEADKLVDEAARVLQLEELLDRRPGELSGGQRQRVAIGRALVRKVDVFLFDEPLSNLDAKLRAELRVELKRLHQELGATMIYVTHDQVEALTLADRIAVMKDGVVQQLDSPEEIYRRPANRYVAQFVGLPSMNFVNGVVTESGAIQTEDFELALDQCNLASTPAPGTEVEIGIRPEHVHPANAGGFMLDVGMVELLGSERLIWGKVGNTSIVMRDDPDTTIRSGDQVRINLKPGAFSVFSAKTGLRI
ncbi:ABC transporter ATP-binding protein [Phaeobacter inhibens]|nr:ABC transporter ATP-binding protein [Phaeobacter inhibens]